ncbi:uncharacterized protein LOC120127309 [Hibiscus syriacus]|uniref:uncharacterized protein LOC120127309 n=1 Tax=Hibiscus syriacus TaxID=106335 RepID=UPI001924FD15|nr:uncharacterized protein LOC120127309 [Hibiscus syriacus]
MNLRQGLKQCSIPDSSSRLLLDIVVGGFDRFQINLIEFLHLPLTNYLSSDEMPWQYSSMSKDDPRICGTPMNFPGFRFCSARSAGASYPLYGNVSNVCSLPRQRLGYRGTVPILADIFHSGDLRREALLQSGQMRTQPSGPLFELPFGSEQEIVVNVLRKGHAYL